MKPWNKGPKWTEEKLQRALKFCQDGWSTRVALSMAGIRKNIDEELKDHPIFQEMKRLSNERAVARRKFITF